MSTYSSTAGKKSVMVALAAVAVVSGVLMAVGMIAPAAADFTVQPFPPGNIYFVPEVKFDEQFVEFCGLAGSTIELAAYSLKSTLLGEALVAAHNRGVTVQVVTDQDNTGSTSVIKLLTDAGIPVMPDNKESLMHDKFMIVDRRYLWTGSTNLTTDGTQNNYNDSLIFDAGDNGEMVQNYLAEFKEMFEDELFSTSSPANTPYPETNIGGVTIEVYFAPEDNSGNVMGRLLDTVSAATESIDILIFSFTDDTLSRTLRDKAKEGITVRVLMDGTQAANQYAEYDTLRKRGIDVEKEDTPYLLHHKMTIVDKKVVTTGSFNFSASANTKNDENMIIIYDETLATDYYYEAFKTRYAALNPGISLKGFVHITEALSGDMLGVSGVQVRLTEAAGGVDLLTTSDEHGWFSFRNLDPNGSYTVHAQKNGYLASEQSSIALAADGVTRISLPLTEITTWGSLGGQVTDSRSTPLSMARITVTYPAEAGAPPNAVYTQITGVSDSAGNYLVDRIPAYSWDVFGQSYPVDVMVEKSGYVTFTQASLDQIESGQTYTLNAQLQQSYQISGFSNPILDEWVVITVKGQPGTTTPTVHLLQQNYLSVEVSMTELTAGQGLFTGPYRILNQYPGQAQIIVNNGESVGTFVVRVLQPREGGQVASADKAMMLSVSSEALMEPLPVTIFNSADPVNRDLKILSRSYRVGPVSGSRGIPVELALSYRPELLPPDGSGEGQWAERLAVYACRRETGRYEYLPSQVDTASSTVHARDVGFSEYVVLLDDSAPEITVLNDSFDDSGGTETALFSVLDNLSGIDLHGLEVTLDGQVADFSYNRLTGTLSVRRPRVAPLDEEYQAMVTVKDLAGNRSDRVLTLQGAAFELTGVAGYPNPVGDNQDMTVRFTLSAAADMIVTICDFSGNQVRGLAAGDQYGQGTHTALTWDGQNDFGQDVANGVYFLEVSGRSGGTVLEKRCKIAVLR